MPSKIRAVLLALATGALLDAQSLPIDVEIPVTGVTYDPDFPIPEQVIGHRIGTRHTRPDQIVTWFHEVGRRSDRVVVETHGWSWEGRPLVHAVVTSPENHARLKEIRRANRRLALAAGDAPDDQLAAMPLVAWMGYGVHGNEASAHEAPALLLYHLAAGRGEQIDRLLREAVVLILPDYNPDGHDRFVDWVNGNRAAAVTIDEQDREHREPWPGGRVNHYLFDLNRDWVPAVHPSTRARLELWDAWRPQLHTDFHEMGGERSYFFQPGIPSRTNPLTPAQNQDLTRAIARFHGEALDRVGQPWFSEESFDDFYYGKGSTYPDVRGGVGILFEQGSSRALLRDTSWGRLDYATTIRNQVITSLSSLEAGIELRGELLRHQRDFYRGAPEVASAAPYEAVVIATEGATTRAQELAALLGRHGITVHALAQPIEVPEAGRYEPGRAFVVPVDQREALLVRALLEPVHEFPDSEFYDVSTWALPLAYALQHAMVETLPAGVLGERIEVLGPSGGRRVRATTERPPAIALRWDRLYAPRALSRLWEAGAQPRLLTRAATWSSGGSPVECAPGTIVVPTGIDSLDLARLEAAIDDAVREDHVEIFELDGGLPLRGPAPGGPSTVAIPRPEIALLAGEGTPAYDVGEVWFALGERYRLPVSLIEQRDAGRLELDRYDVVIACGDPGPAGEAVVKFVRGGGTLVALGRAADFAVTSELLPGAMVGETPPPPPPETELPFGDRRRARALERIAGAILRVDLDETHPLAFAVTDPLPVFRTSTARLKSSLRAVGRYSHEPVLSGYVPESQRMALDSTPAMVAEPSGRGRVVVCLDDLAFRGFFLGSERVLVNAVVFAPAF